MVNKPDWLTFITALQKLEQDACNQGLWVTRRAINGAIRAAGWEKGGDRSMALKRAQDAVSSDPRAEP